VEPDCYPWDNNKRISSFILLLSHPSFHLVSPLSIPSSPLSPLKTTIHIPYVDLKLQLRMWVDFLMEKDTPRLLH
jgi:hypothetical protein